MDSRNSIPTMLHFVWLGGVLNEAGRENIINWRNKNPNYEMNLWIDSATFLRDEQGKLMPTFNYDNLIKWAKKEKVIIHDLSLKKNDPLVILHFPFIQSEDTFLSKMESRRFYEDELSGTFRNLAAASDILRCEILYQQGGVYIDVLDMFSGEKGLGNLQPNYGFLMRINPDLAESYNNDLIASYAHGDIITAFRNYIYEKYWQLYENDKLLAAHRNANFYLDSRVYGEDIAAKPRFQTTLNISGPDALLESIKTLSIGSNPLYPELNINIDDPKTFPIIRRLGFDAHFFKSLGHAGSWFNSQDFKVKNKILVLNWINKKLNTILDHENNLDRRRVIQDFQKYFSAFPVEDLSQIYSLYMSHTDEFARNRLLDVVGPQFLDEFAFTCHYFDSLINSSNSVSAK